MSSSAHQHTTLDGARAARIGRRAAAEAYEQARLRLEPAEAVRTRREALGLTQWQLAERGHDPARRCPLRGRGTTPTIPALERLATALGLQLTISLSPDARRSA